MNSIFSFQTSGSDLSGPTVHLTPRQLDVLQLLCTGKPNKVIGRKLGIASATVKVHVSCILRMLKVESRLQAVLKAHELGLVRVDQNGKGEDDRPGSVTPMRPIWGPAPAGTQVMPFAQAASAVE